MSESRKARNPIHWKLSKKNKIKKSLFGFYYFIFYLGRSVPSKVDRQPFVCGSLLPPDCSDLFFICFISFIHLSFIFLFLLSPFRIYFFITFPIWEFHFLDCKGVGKSRSLSPALIFDIYLCAPFPPIIDKQLSSTLHSSLRLTTYTFTLLSLSPTGPWYYQPSTSTTLSTYSTYPPL